MSLCSIYKPFVHSLDKKATPLDTKIFHSNGLNYDPSSVCRPTQLGSVLLQTQELGEMSITTPIDEHVHCRLLLPPTASSCHLGQSNSDTELNAGYFVLYVDRVAWISSKSTK